MIKDISRSKSNACAYNVYSEDGVYLFTVANARTLARMLLPEEIDRFKRDEIKRPDNRIIYAMHKKGGFLKSDLKVYYSNGSSKNINYYIGYAFEQGIHYDNMIIMAYPYDNYNRFNIDDTFEHDSKSIKEHLKIYAPELLQ